MGWGWGGGGGLLFMAQIGQEFALYTVRCGGISSVGGSGGETDIRVGGVHFRGAVAEYLMKGLRRSGQ